MPSDTFKRAVDRMLSGRMGETATVTNYTDTGAVDDYGDPTDRQVANEATGVSALFRSPEELAVDDDLQVGIDSSRDTFVYLPDDQSVVEAGEGERYPTEITRESTGEVFGAIRVCDEGNGEYRVLAREV